MLNSKGYLSFQFCDSVTNGDIATMEQLCDYIIESGISVGWFGPIRSRQDMTFGLWKKMKLAGCSSVNLGVESGSQKILNLMRKGYNIQTIEKNLRDMTKAGIITTINIIVGFPGETEETVMETVNFLKRNHKNIKVLSTLAQLYLEPVSELTERYAEYGVISYWSPGEWSHIDGKNTSEWRLRQCAMIYNLAESLDIKTGCSSYKQEISALQMRDEIGR